MAAAETEARGQAEEPAPQPPRVEETKPPAAPEKRAPADGEDGEAQEDRPEPKRRRASVAALPSLRRAAPVAAASEEEEEDVVAAGEPADGCDGLGSFSFHARSFSGVGTTPKFGSFNPAAAELVAFDLTPPPPRIEDEAPAVAEEGAVAGGGGDGEEAAEGNDGNSH